MRMLLLTTVIALVSSPLFAQTVQCDGTESGGTGANSCDASPRLYAYPVTNTGAEELTYVYIGTDDCVPNNYTAICMPADWTFAVVKVSLPHDPEKTAHGAATNATPPSMGPCRVEFTLGTGAPIAAPGAFTFGFNHDEPSHDVDWEAGAITATWGDPSGDGFGPVHGPKVKVPTVSEWGVAVMTLLVLVAGTVVMMRRRKAAVQM